MKNKPLKDIAARFGVACESTAIVTGFQVDSRRLQPEELFFALPGDRTDGHNFLDAAADRRAAGAVVSVDYKGPDYGLELLRVENVLDALQDLAWLAALEFKGKIVGITGSMGKTTTKDFTATLLEGKFRVGKTYSSYNTRLTLPITILNMNGDEDVWVLEMGMGEPGDIAKLVSIAPPDIAVITQVTMAHYGDIFKDGLEGVARSKAEIFGNERTKKAIHFYGGDFPEVKCDRLTFSLENSAADYFLSHGVVDERGVRAFEFEIPFPQPHVQHNFLAAVVVARTLGMEWVEIEGQVEKLQLPKMRFEQFERNGILFINDAYNANPVTMKAALSCVPEPKQGGKRIALLGRMVDLGPFSVGSHSEVGHFAQGHVDHLLTLGDEAIPLLDAFAEVKKPAEHFTDLESMKKRLKELMREGDVVIAKGSRDLAMERIFEGL